MQCNAVIVISKNHSLNAYLLGTYENFENKNSSATKGIRCLNEKNARALPKPSHY